MKVCTRLLLLVEFKSLINLANVNPTITVFKQFSKVSSSYHLCVKYFSQLSYDSEMYTKSCDNWEKYSTQRRLDELTLIDGIELTLKVI